MKKCLLYVPTWYIDNYYILHLKYVVFYTEGLECEKLNTVAKYVYIGYNTSFVYKLLNSLILNMNLIQLNYYCFTEKLYLLL